MPRIADPALAERRRQEILEAALACFRRNGFHQSSMQAICAEAGLSPGALYRYFPSKADIIAAIVEADRATVAEVLSDTISARSLVNDLVRCAQILLARYDDPNRGALVADTLGEAARDPALAQRIAAMDEGARAEVAQAIKRAQTFGHVDPDIDPAQTAELLFAAMDGLFLRMAVLRIGDVARIVDDFRALAERLLAPHPHPASETA